MQGFPQAVLSLAVDPTGCSVGQRRVAPLPGQAIEPVSRRDFVEVGLPCAVLQILCAERGWLRLLDQNLVDFAIWHELFELANLFIRYVGAPAINQS